MLEIFDNLRKKNTTGQGNEKRQRVERRHFEWKTRTHPFSRLICHSLIELLMSVAVVIFSIFLSQTSEKDFSRNEYSGQILPKYIFVVVCLLLFLLFYYIVYFFITLPQDHAVWRLPPYKHTCRLDRLYSSRSTAQLAAEKLQGTT